jgi:peptidoglycan/LPS O-acetylase OafA/YrhL
MTLLMTFLRNFKIDWFLFLRFLAAVMVIRQHVEFEYPKLVFGNQNWGWLLGGYNNSGAQAVVFFFVLSGYLMAKVCLSGKYTLDARGIINFWFNRVKRLLPIYYVVCIFSLLVGFRYLLEPFKYNIPRLLKIFGLNYDGSFPFNQVIWTVGIEMLFYLVCPFLFLLYKPIQKSKVLSFLVFIVSLWSFDWGLSVQFPLSAVSSFVEFMPIFWAGASAYLVIAHLPKLKTKFPIVSIFSVLVLIALMIPWKEFLGLDYRLGITLVTLLFVAVKEVFDPEYRPQKNVFNQLGLLSLGIYFWHILILSKLKLHFVDFFTLLFGSMIANYLIWLMTIVLSIGVAQLTFVLVEIPAAKWLDRHKPKFFDT